MKIMKGKRFLSLVLTLSMVLSLAPVTAMADEAPALPTATVTEIEKDDLTFAMNFKADDVTAEQLAYYKDWYADFELTVNKDVTFNENGGADGYLSGQYDAWSENWVNVPFEDVTLEADESLKIMAYAAEMLGQSGLKLTYNDVYTSVKDFDCGVFFEPEFLAANPDLEVTLELRMYNPADENESYTIGEAYEFTVEALVPELPTATVTELENDELTFAMNFLADDATEKQLEYYGDWYADFVLTVNKDVTFNADGSADGYLSGQYDAWGSDWVDVPETNVTLKANEPLKIMEYAAELMGASGLKLTYNDVYTFVEDFDCGVFFEEEFLVANPDLEVTLELRMYNPEDSDESYAIGETYEFTMPALPTATVKDITDETDLTFAMNFLADYATEEQLEYYGDWYADFVLTVNKDVTFNADGSADGYLSGQYDAWGSDWVKVPETNVTLKANEALKIMEYAAELMGASGLKLTYNDVYTFVEDFDCGVFFGEEFLAANPGLEVTLELRMYYPEDESISHVIGETYTFTTAPEAPATVEVTFNTNGGSAISSVDVEVGNKVTKPSNPTRSGYTFAGWYTDADCTDAYDFDTVVTEAMTLYAKWTKDSSRPSGGGGSRTRTYAVGAASLDDADVTTSKKNAAAGQTVVITVTPEEGKEVAAVTVTDKNGNVLDVKQVGENEYSFVMPKSEVDIDVTMDTVHDHEIVLTVGSNTYYKNDDAKCTDVAPVIVGERTLVPIRVIVEALGGEVIWNDAARTVIMNIDGKVLTLVIDQEIPGFGTGAIIMNGRTMVPIRYVSEYVGADVEWIAETQQVIIRK